LVKYLIFLVIGVLFGYFIGSKREPKYSKHVLNTTVLILLFFMGVSIGKDPKLMDKISMFGYTSLIISLFTVAFSVIVVAVLMRVFKK